jgi:membrane-bound lytic murein transglycosylase F
LVCAIHLISRNKLIIFKRGSSEPLFILRQLLYFTLAMIVRSCLVLSFFILISFSCNRKDDGRTSLIALDLEEIKKRGYINALVDNNSFSYFIYKGHSMGYEYELLKLFASHLGVDLRIKVTSGVVNAMDKLNRGEGDILAFPLTVTKERTEQVTFTNPHFNSYQVLVQRKPSDWRELSQDKIDQQVIRNVASLIGKEVHVMANSSYLQRIKNLSEEIGGDIIIKEDSLNSESESLIKAVALGQIEYTVADYQIAMVNAAYYPNLDVSTVLSLPQQIAWAARKNSPELLNATNEWLIKIKKEPTFMVIYNRYFKSPRTSLIRMKSDYSSIGGNKISPYDALIKAGATRLNWDWRLLAAIVYQESKFKNGGESWAGARGLMQLMPATAERFGATNPDDPKQSIRAGVTFLKYLNKYWTKSIASEEERLKFVLASYNAGLSHIIDARQLAIKYKRNPNEWNNVEYYLLRKSEAEYFRDPVVKAGYCKCEEPVNYVKSVLEKFEEYKNLIQ